MNGFFQLGICDRSIVIDFLACFNCKEKQKNADSGKTKDKLQMDKGKTAVETSARSAKKTKTAQKGVTEEVKAEDDNMFGVEPYTDAEAKKQLEAQNKLLKSSKAKPKNGNVITEEVMKLRQRQEYIKAAEKKKTKRSLSDCKNSTIESVVEVPQLHPTVTIAMTILILH